MANHETNRDHWTEQRLASLIAPKDWTPDPVGVLALLRNRGRARRAAARRWIMAAAATSASFGTLFVVPATRACAQQPVGCAREVLGRVLSEERHAPPLVVAVSPRAAELPEPPKPNVAEAPAKPAVTAPVAAESGTGRPEQRSFKESGNAAALLGVEIYGDFECPPCADFSLNVVPLFVAQYVKTGKAKLLYRDFPLPVHRFAALAARYADAAGERGYYDVAREHIFRTQSAWKRDGDIDTRLSEVLPANVMREVRELVKADPKLDEMIAADLASANADRINQTPSLVLVYQGKRQIIPGAVTFQLLKSYLDGLEK